MSDDTTGRRRTSPLDDDDLLLEILLRVPPQPSSLPRASLVCKRWRRLVSDRCFRRRLRAHHRKPPLLGFFEHHVVISKHCHRLDVKVDFVFDPILEPPDRIPPQRFSLGWLPSGTRLLGCRHGRVLLLDTSINVLNTVVVCDPVTGGHVRLVIPPEFTDRYIDGTVFCAAGEQGHVHGACHWSPFKVVLVSVSDHCPMVCVYSSETGLWGNIIRHDNPGMVIVYHNSSTLIGRALYWTILTCGSQEVEDDDDLLMCFGAILEFDLDTQTLTVIRGPPMEYSDFRQNIKAIDGGVGFATWSSTTSRLRVWHLNVNGRDVATTWVLAKTVDLHNIFGLKEHERMQVSGRECFVLGYDEDDGVLFIHVDTSLFMLQLDSMQFKRRYQSTSRRLLRICHPFRSFYPAGAVTTIGSDGD